MAYSAGKIKDRSSTHLSKRLSWILRHGAKNEGLEIGEDGFAKVNDVLKCKSFLGITEANIKEVVISNDKQRFAIHTCPETGQLLIRANQGHSFQVNELQLAPVLSGIEVPAVIHGTTINNWNKIKNEGLSRMNRIHIHFATAEPNSKEVISGARSSSKVLIYIDIDKAISDGILFYRSANNVILSPGDTQGLISPKYFKKVTILE